MIPATNTGRDSWARPRETFRPNDATRQRDYGALRPMTEDFIAAPQPSMQAWLNRPRPNLWQRLTGRAL